MTATSKNFTAFSFTTPPATGDIDALDVVFTVPISTDVTDLIAVFATTGASVKIEGVLQTSGVTPNDYTYPITYTVIATDLSEQNYTVTVYISKVKPFQIGQLRRVIAEPTATTYSDALLTSYLEKYSHIDSEGEQPDQIGWIGTYDIYAAAGDIWEEKAALKIEKFDFTADGVQASQSQQYEQFMKQARSCRSRRLPSSVTLIKSPKELLFGGDEGWIGNLPESD